MDTHDSKLRNYDITPLGSSLGKTQSSIQCICDMLIITWNEPWVF